jgi:hypothetical protein
MSQQQQQQQQQESKRFMFLSPERIEKLKRLPLRYKILIASQCLFAIGLTKYAQYKLTKDKDQEEKSSISIYDNNYNSIATTKLPLDPLVQDRIQRNEEKLKKFEDSQIKRYN